MKLLGADVHPDDPAKMIELIDESQSTGSPLSFRLEYRAAVGEEATFRLIVMDGPNAVLLSGSCKIRGGVRS